LPALDLRWKRRGAIIVRVLRDLPMHEAREIPNIRDYLESLRLKLAAVESVPLPAPDDRKSAAVLVPLMHREGALEVLYTRRSDRLASHTGQVAFPGRRTNATDIAVTPFVGVIEGDPQLRRDPKEVAEIFHVPLQALSDPRYRGSYRWKRNGTSSDYPAILYAGQVIWGLTYSLTLTFLQLIDGIVHASQP